MTDVAKLANVLGDKFGDLTVDPDYGWYDPALDVLDCVLSLNRRYDSFVLPRIKSFAGRNPQVTELLQLRDLIEHYSTPLEFSIKELNYNDERRAGTLVGVVSYLLEAQRKFKGKSERTRLRAWARSVQPIDHVDVGVKGFGLAGFQYLRMLFGVQTTKPDIYVKRFVGKIVGHPVTDIAALALLEAAAKQKGLLLREVDGVIWRSAARKHR